MRMRGIVPTVREIRNRGYDDTGTAFDIVPSDIIGMLAEYTKPTSVWWYTWGLRTNVFATRESALAAHRRCARKWDKCVHDHNRHRYRYPPALQPPLPPDISAVKKGMAVLRDGIWFLLQPINRLYDPDAPPSKKKRRKKAPRCSGRTKKGKKCSTHTNDASGRCPTHRGQ